MQLLCFALSLAVIQYIDHAGKAHDHGKQNGTAKSAAGKADIRIEHNQCGKKHQDDASPYKFVKSVMSAIDPKYADQDEFSLLKVLEETSGREMPQAIKDDRKLCVL